MRKQRLFPIALATGLAVLGTGAIRAAATPAIWESDFGSAIASLTGSDDATAFVDLSFSFPFAGANYTRVFVGSNGGLQLGGLGANATIDFNHWESLEDFLSDAAPSVDGFNSDLDLGTTGTIHVNDFGDRAVFTWNEVGTFESPLALLTFQISLHADGRIVLGYDGILDGPGEDLILDLDEGIVVGVTPGDIPQGTDPGTHDLSSGFAGGTTIHERWCHTIANSCGFGAGSSEGLSGPINTAFDLDQRNVVFVPAQGGFLVPEPGAVATRAVALLALAALARAPRRVRREG